MSTVTRAKLAFISVSVLLAATGLSASPITINLNHEFSGADSPSGSGPWLRATFEDYDTDQVKLTMTSLLQGAGEFVSVWMFNVHLTNPGNDLTASAQGTTSGQFSARDYNGNQGHKNEFKADGDGFFDFKFSWSNDEFVMGSKEVFILEGEGITANSFYKLSLGAGNSPDGLLSAAHVQGIFIEGGEPGNTEGSGWITYIPLPSAGAMCLVGILGLGGLRQRRR